jgi:DNA-binding NarL/FixJ family response regulator
MTNRELADRLKTEKTVARHISNIFNKLDLNLVPPRRHMPINRHRLTTAT